MFWAGITKMLFQFLAAPSLRNLLVIIIGSGFSNRFIGAVFFSV